MCPPELQQGSEVGDGEGGAGLAVAALEAVPMAAGAGEAVAVLGDDVERLRAVGLSREGASSAGEDVPPGAGADVHAPRPSVIPRRKAVIHRQFTENPSAICFVSPQFTREGSAP